VLNVKILWKTNVTAFQDSINSDNESPSHPRVLPTAPITILPVPFLDPVALSGPGRSSDGDATPVSGALLPASPSMEHAGSSETEGGERLVVGNGTSDAQAASLKVTAREKHANTMSSFRAGAKPLRSKFATLYSPDKLWSFASERGRGLSLWLYFVVLFP